MSDVAVSPLPGAAPVDEQPVAARNVFAGVFVMSFSSLLLELALTRLFSVILFYHFAFLAVSIALLGLGAGGVFAYLKREWLARWNTRALGASLAALNAVAIVATLELVLHVPVALSLTRTSFLHLTAIYLSSAVPFFVTGLVFSVVFARERHQVAGIYAADLVGGAGACIAMVPLLDFIGGPNTVLCAAVGMAIASAIWAETAKRRRIAALLAFTLVALIAANYSGRLIDVVYMKGARQSNVEFARWNAISRVDVSGYGAGPRYARIDADAGTAIMNVDPSTWRGSDAERHMMAEAPSVANVLRPRGDYAIIGPGGGVDVLRAVGNGSPSVTGIEINPLIANRIMRGRYAEYSHHLYDLPTVHMNVADGRSWIRGTRQQFDVVQMTLVDTWASTAAGAFALSENNLYTVEAFKEYFAHLRPNGIVAITRWEFQRPREALRVVSVEMEALRQLGVPDYARHFIIVAQKPLTLDGVPVTVIASREPFTAEDEQRARTHASDANLDVLYLPSVPQSNEFNRLVTTGNPYAYSRTYAFNVAPVSDNAPFFFFTMKSGDIMNGGLMRGIDWKVNVGVAVLGMVLVISLVAVAIFLLLPLAWRTKRPARGRRLLYFIAIGLGYILVEIAFIQRFVLFLGHPTYAITVVVFLMLLASGLGSMMSTRLAPRLRTMRFPPLIVAAGILVYVEALPRVLTGLVGLPFGVKLLLSGALLAPLGFVMGMPFPSGLRALAGSGDQTIEWAWALNAASSVLGSVLAMVIAIQFGLQTTLVCGAVAYAGAMMLATTFGTQAGECQ